LAPTVAGSLNGFALALQAILRTIEFLKSLSGELRNLLVHLVVYNCEAFIESL
jgi:hypothetical protein